MRPYEREKKVEGRLVMRSMRHHKVYVIRVLKYVVTKETNVFAAVWKVTCLRIIECVRLLGKYIYIYIYIHTHM
jgi:hypothetical protein